MLISLLLPGVYGADCFDPAENLMPRLLSYTGSGTTGYEKFTAIAGNSDFVIVGGTTNRGDLASHGLGNVDLTMMYRTELSTRLYKWGKVISTESAAAVKIEALAVSPSTDEGHLIAAFTTVSTSDSVGHLVHYLTTYSASDGGIRTATQKIDVSTN